MKGADWPKFWVWGRQNRAYGTTFWTTHHIKHRLKGLLLLMKHLLKFHSTLLSEKKKKFYHSINSIFMLISLPLLTICAIGIIIDIDV